MSSPASKPSRGRSAGATGFVAGAPIGIPIGRHQTAWRMASIAAAAVLVLIALATIGAVLRMGDDEQAPGIAATASMMPFAPASALASPTPEAICTTDDTLLLTPEEPVAPDTFAELPFGVAWYRDGTLTVERQGEVVREIEIGDADDVRPAGWPNVVLASTRETGSNTTFINIQTGDILDIGPTYGLHHWTDGPFVFFATDPAQYERHLLDLRSFEQVNLTDRFAVTPAESWLPSVQLGNASDDGTVLLISTRPIRSYTGATPTAPAEEPDQPELQLSRQALLVNGSLDDISIVGPMATSSGGSALSPDGATMAWLAPSEQGGERILTIADTTTGNVMHAAPVDATYSNSLMFNADGSILYSTHGTTLERIVVRPNEATPFAAPEPITLPDTAYRILAASQDREQLLLARTQNAAGEVSIWLDLATVEMREFEGTLGRLWESTFPSDSAPAINSHVLIDDLLKEASVLNLETGEIVTSVDRQDGVALTTISADGSTLLVPHEASVDLLDLSRGSTTTHAAPEGAEGFPQPLAMSPDGSCATVSWRLESEERDPVLLSASSDTSTPLPPAEIDGWVPRASAP